MPPKQCCSTAVHKLHRIELAGSCHGTPALASLLRMEGASFSTLADFGKQEARRDLDRNPTRGATSK